MDAARRFLAIRLNLGLHQQAFADSLGISLRAEQNYERGARKLTAEVLNGIAEKYGIDPIWVMNGPEERPRALKSTKLDHSLLAKSIELVTEAIKATGTTVEATEQARMITAVYQFYMDNASGAGAEHLVTALIGAKR